MTTNRHSVAVFDFATMFGLNQLVIFPTIASGGTLASCSGGTLHLQFTWKSSHGSGDGCSADRQLGSLITHGGNSITQAVPNSRVIRKVFLKHQVNTVCSGIRDQPWRNVQNLNNSVEILKDYYLYLVVGRYVPTMIIRVHNKDWPWFDDQRSHAFEAHLRWTREEFAAAK